MPGNRLEIMEGAGHFPHRADPERFAALVRAFVGTTEPAVLDPDKLRRLLQAGKAQAPSST